MSILKGSSGTIHLDLCSFRNLFVQSLQLKELNFDFKMVVIYAT